LPIAILGGAGRELEQPLAVVILGGMLSSTTLTLLVVPALFKIFGLKALNNRSQDTFDFDPTTHQTIPMGDKTHA